MERLDQFMARANAAYYATHDPFADFTTAPEITQVFGELLGAWAAVQWRAMGQPDPVVLVEAGPGRGTLMADALRAAALMPGFRAALQVHFIETSPRLRTIQAAAVPGAVWHDTLDSVPAGPILLLANEFLDALPIRQFVQRGNDWTERYVQDGTLVELPPEHFPPSLLHLGGSSAGQTSKTRAQADPLWPDWAQGEGSSLLGTASPAGPHPILPHERRTAPGDALVFEVNEAALAFVGAVTQRVSAQGGAALFIDYGPARSAPGDSLQALRHGTPASPFDAPGEADLTAHVDFEALATTARAAGATVYGPRAQGLFLAGLGLFQRTGRLAERQPAAKAAALIQAAQRLAEPDRMGRLFQALVIQHPSLPPPPGYA